MLRGGVSGRGHNNYAIQRRRSLVFLGDSRVRSNPRGSGRSYARRKWDTQITHEDTVNIDVQIIKQIENNKILIKEEKLFGVVTVLLGTHYTQGRVWFPVLPTHSDVYDPRHTPGGYGRDVHTTGSRVRHTWTGTPGRVRVHCSHRCPRFGVSGTSSSRESKKVSSALSPIRGRSTLHAPEFESRRR